MIGSRRRWCSILCGFALLMGGCTDRAARAPAPAAGPLRLLNWAEYLDEGVLAAFTERTGIPVELTTFSSCAEMMSMVKVNPAAHDLVIVDDSVIATLIELRLLQPLDPARLHGLEHLESRFLNLPADPGNRYSVPYLWGTTLLAYRTDHVAAPPTSWSALWDTNYAGHVMMLDDSQEDFGAALLTLGHSINTTNAAAIEQARQKLLAQRPLVRRYADFLSIKAALDAGDGWLGPLYSGDAALLAETNGLVASVIPAEGAALWVDSFAIPRDAEHPEAAHRFISFLLEPAIAASNAAALASATPNRTALPLLPAEQRADANLYPAPEILRRCELYHRLDQGRMRLFNAAWPEIAGGATPAAAGTAAGP